MDSEMISWQFLKRADATISILDAGKHLHITKQWTLVIKKLGMADVGQYFCVEGGEYMAVYQLDVLTAETRKVVSVTDTAVTIIPNSYGNRRTNPDSRAKSFRPNMELIQIYYFCTIF